MQLPAFRWHDLTSILNCWHQPLFPLRAALSLSSNLGGTHMLLSLRDNHRLSPLRQLLQLLKRTEASPPKDALS